MGVKTPTVRLMTIPTTKNNGSLDPSTYKNQTVDNIDVMAACETNPGSYPLIYKAHKAI